MSQEFYPHNPEAFVQLTAGFIQVLKTMYDLEKPLCEQPHPSVTSNAQTPGALEALHALVQQKHTQFTFASLDESMQIATDAIRDTEVQAAGLRYLGDDWLAGRYSLGWCRYNPPGGYSQIDQHLSWSRIERPKELDPLRRVYALQVNTQEDLVLRVAQGPSQGWVHHVNFALELTYRRRLHPQSSQLELYSVWAETKLNEEVVRWAGRMFG